MLTTRKHGTSTPIARLMYGSLKTNASGHLQTLVQPTILSERHALKMTTHGMSTKRISAFGLPNLGFTAVLLLLIQHGFLFYDLLSTLPEVGGRQRRPL